MLRSLVGSEMCIRDSSHSRSHPPPQIWKLPPHSAAHARREREYVAHIGMRRTRFRVTLGNFVPCCSMQANSQTQTTLWLLVLSVAGAWRPKTQAMEASHSSHSFVSCLCVSSLNNATRREALPSAHFLPTATRCFTKMEGSVSGGVHASAIFEGKQRVSAHSSPAAGLGL